jgi:hypothetical protein
VIDTDSNSDTEYDSDTSADEAARERRRKRRRHRRQVFGESSKRLPRRVTKVLKRWMLSPEHYENPYPDEANKRMLMEQTGITLKQLTTWFTNQRKRFWAPRRRERGEPIPLNFTSQVSGLAGSPSRGGTKRKSRSSSPDQGTTVEPISAPVSSAPLANSVAPTNFSVVGQFNPIPLPLGIPVEPAQITGTPVASSSNADDAVVASKPAHSRDTCMDCATSLSGHCLGSDPLDVDLYHCDLPDIFADEAAMLDLLSPFWTESDDTLCPIHPPPAPLDVVPLLKASLVAQQSGPQPASPQRGFDSNLTPLKLRHSKATSSA